MNANKKLWVVLGAAILVIGLTLGGAALGVNAEERQAALDVLKWLVGFFVGGHTLTDIASQVVGSKKKGAS